MKPLTMSEITERTIRENLANSPKMGRTDTHDAMAEIDALRARVAEVEAERDKAAIRAHLVDVAAEHESAFNLTSLAASQAEVRELREALKAAWPTLHYYGHRPGEQHVNASPTRRSVADVLDLAGAALSRPPGDDTALREVCRKVAEEVRRTVNARAEADMLRGNPITGAHHRALDALDMKVAVNDVLGAPILGQPGDDAAPTKEE